MSHGNYLLFHVLVGVVNDIRLGQCTMIRHNSRNIVLAADFLVIELLCIIIHNNSLCQSCCICFEDIFNCKAYINRSTEKGPIGFFNY